MKIFRHLKAKFLRTFVADCPVCHQHFYGHQAYGTQVRIKSKHYRIICHRCAKEHAK